MIACILKQRVYTHLYDTSGVGGHGQRVPAFITLTFTHFPCGVRVFEARDFSFRLQWGGSSATKLCSMRLYTQKVARRSQRARNCNDISERYNLAQTRVPFPVSLPRFYCGECVFGLCIVCIVNATRVCCVKAPFSPMKLPAHAHTRKSKIPTS